MNHTPTPWKEFKSDVYAGTNLVARVYAEVGMSDELSDVNCKSNADFIVTACNAHEELVKALELGINTLHPSDERGECLCSQCDFVRAKKKALAKAGVKQ